MSAQHTPGPWIAVGAWVEHPDDSIPDICTCDPEDMGQEGRSDKEIRANARLIAAAPDLLEACKLIVSAFDALAPISAARNEPLQINAARAAIVKAGGAA